MITTLYKHAWDLGNSSTRTRSLLGSPWHLTKILN